LGVAFITIGALGAVGLRKAGAAKS
jgi:hypothetical protein